MTENLSASSFNRFVYEYYNFGKSLAQKVLNKCIKRIGIQKAYSKLFSPVTDWSRFAEFFIVFEILRNNLREGNVVLDVGSPKLFPIWLTTKMNLNFVCTDIWDYAVSEYSDFWDEINKKVHSKIRFEVANLLDLKYNDNEFDAIFSISTIEHAFHPDWKNVISENLARILKKDGMLIITTPFGSKSISQYKSHSEYSPEIAKKNENFFMRIIDSKDLNEFVEICKKSGLHLEKTYTTNMKASRFSIFVRLLPVHLNVLFGFMKPRFAIRNYIIKEGQHVALDEKYQKRWSPDMITSDIILVFKKISH